MENHSCCPHGGPVPWSSGLEARNFAVSVSWTLQTSQLWRQLDCSPPRTQIRLTMFLRDVWFSLPSKIPLRKTYTCLQRALMKSMSRTIGNTFELPNKKSCARSWEALTLISKEKANCRPLRKVDVKSWFFDLCLWQWGNRVSIPCLQTCEKGQELMEERQTAGAKTTTALLCNTQTTIPPCWNYRTLSQAVRIFPLSPANYHPGWTPEKFSSFLKENV